MKTQAIEKIKTESAAYKGNKYGNAMKTYISGILEEFCNQNEEFAQAVVQGGSFADCMDAVTKAIQGGAISDLDACRAAAAFFFPGCVVEFHMIIHMSEYEAEDQTQNGNILLRLEDYL